jgi:hypothetical protein
LICQRKSQPITVGFFFVRAYPSFCETGAGTSWLDMVSEAPGE